MFGLFSSDVRVPLKSVSYVGVINEHIGEFTITQEYKTSKKLSNVEYAFPLSQTARITNITININDRVLQSRLIERQQAKREYKQAVEEKHKALILEKVNLGYRVQIGNVESSDRILVKYTYFDQLVYESNHYKLVVPTTIADHYSPNGKSKTYSTNATCTIDVTWFSTNTITDIKSLSHPQTQITQHSNYASVNLTSDKLVNDWNLLCKTKHNIDAQYYEEDKYIYSSYFIKYDTKKQIVNQLTNIFVIDCSGSMSGNKIEQAKNALTLFLKSLDTNTKYNIITFGDEYKLMYTESQDYTEANLKNTLEQVSYIDANMGGTELLQPIKYLLTLQNTNAFLLTDGQVTNITQITNRIREKKHSTTRFFTIGIGNEADRKLCQEIAHYGAGTCKIVIDTEQLNETIINQYITSKYTYYSNVSFNFDSDVQVTTNFNYIIPGYIYRLYTKTPKEKRTKDVVMSFTDMKGTHYKQEFKNVVCLPTNKLLKRAFANCIISNIEHNVNPYNYDLVKLSMEEKILCSKTAFIIVDTDSKVTVTNESEEEDWFETYPNPTNLKGRLLRLENPLGINTVHESLKIPNLDLRPIPSAKMMSASPWNNSLATNSYSSHRTMTQSAPRQNMCEYSSSQLNNLTSDYKHNLRQKDISHYQNFDGSFRICDELLRILNTTYDEVLSKAQTSDINTILNTLISAYLKTKPEYALILNKFEKYLTSPKQTTYVLPDLKPLPKQTTSSWFNSSIQPDLNIKSLY